MEKIIFSADSTCDLSKEIIQKLNVKIIPLVIILGNDERLDGIDIQPENIFAFVEKTKILPKTSAISSFSFKEHFERIRDNENTPIIHFDISTKLSACYQNAVNAASEMKNIYVIDGGSLSTGTSLLILKAKDMADKGYNAPQIVEECKNTVPFVQASFVVDTLEYLHKGGRCSGLASFVTGVFKIHPMLQLQDGAIKVANKFRGSMKIAIGKYIEHLAETCQPDLTRAFLTRTEIEPELLNFVREKVKEVFPFKELLETQAGSTITCHCGKGTIGLLFINKTPVVKN